MHTILGHSGRQMMSGRLTITDAKGVCVAAVMLADLGHGKADFPLCSQPAARGMMLWLRVSILFSNKSAL